MGGSPISLCVSQTGPMKCKYRNFWVHFPVCNCYSVLDFVMWTGVLPARWGIFCFAFAFLFSMSHHETLLFMPNCLIGLKHRFLKHILTITHKEKEGKRESAIHWFALQMPSWAGARGRSWEHISDLSLGWQEPNYLSQPHCFPGSVRKLE